MTSKEFLQQAYYAQQEINIKLEQIARLQALATRTTTTLSNTPTGGNKSFGSVIENAIVSLEEQIAKLSDEITALLKISDEVSAAISQVKNPVERKILKYRYLCFFSWKQISALMKTSQRQIYRLHVKAVDNFCTYGSQCH